MSRAPGHATTHLVVRTLRGSSPEVFRFDDAATAAEHYERACRSLHRGNLVTGVYLTRVERSAHREPDPVRVARGDP